MSFSVSEPDASSPPGASVRAEVLLSTKGGCKCCCLMSRAGLGGLKIAKDIQLQLSEQARKWACSLIIVMRPHYITSLRVLRRLYFFFLFENTFYTWHIFLLWQSISKIYIICNIASKEKTTIQYFSEFCLIVSVIIMKHDLNFAVLFG